MEGQRGFSLLEVMVAGVVTALGLSGVAALLLASTASTSAAHLDTRAAMLARHLHATVALSPDAAGTFLATPPVTAPDCARDDACPPADFAAYNYRQWRLAVATELPGGIGLVCRDASPGDGTGADPACDGDGPITVKIFWRDPGSQEFGAHRLWMSAPR